MKRIVFAGIGGVGGYFGGLLAAYYQNSPDVEISFVVRGDNEKAINSYGLRLQTTHGNYTAKPKIATHNCVQIGPVDYVVICCKAYGLEELLTQLKPCITDKTVLLPLLNGVDSPGKIAEAYPANEVWRGCVYLVARLDEPGLVRENGAARQLNFGSDKGDSIKLEEFKNLLTKAGIDARLSAEISATIWEKYAFLAPMATLTAYSNKSIGEVREDSACMELFRELLEEILLLARALDIPLPEDIREKTINKVLAAHYDTKTSMHSDFLKGGPTELESITGYVVNTAHARGIAVPNFEKLYNALRKS